MKILEKNISKNGFDYKQEKRNKKVAMYSQWNKEGDFVALEVFVIKIRPEGEIGGKKILEGEVFPGNEMFGKSAWTFKDTYRATTKFDEITKREMSK